MASGFLKNAFPEIKSMGITSIRSFVFSLLRNKKVAATVDKHESTRLPAFAAVAEERDPWQRSFAIVRTPGKGNRRLRCK